MKQSERASIMRIITDLIEADGIIDTREIAFLESLRKKYGIKKEDEIRASSYTLAMALNELAESDNSLKHDLLGDFMNVAMSDYFCAREEALLILAIRNCLTVNTDRQVSVLSINTSNLNFEESQIIYVESEYDKVINKQIKERYKEICAEIRLSGFDFVYLPQISEHYKSVPESDLLYMSEFLYPKVSEERLLRIIAQLRDLSTERFCKDLLAVKLNVKEMESIAPSVMMKIGNSLVDDQQIGNFLLVEIDDDVLKSIRNILDLFAENYHNYSLNYLQAEKGRFVFKGFYKQIFDILMLRKGIRSTVVIDSLRKQIYFPEADVKIEKIHRREKALYALFLLESRSGGINFNKPSSPKEMERYTKRMAAIQKKYQTIYRLFGGEEDKAPNLEMSEIRLPMISRLKKQLQKLGEILYHVDDYTIQRNMFGNYGVNIPFDLCCCCEDAETGIRQIADSETWQKIYCQ